MKKLLFLVFAVSILASCEKEVCTKGTVIVKNIGTESVTIYSIAEHPTIEPNQTAKVTVEICDGFDVNGYPCGDQVQTSVSFKFANEEMTSKAVVVGRCQTELLEISN